jgi:hypothetical protein
MFPTAAPVSKLAADRKTATVTFTITSLGALPATPGDVSMVLFDPAAANFTDGLDIVASLKCTLPTPIGTWVTVSTKPTLAPRKSLKVVFKGVAVPALAGPDVYALLVIDSACKSSPPIAQFLFAKYFAFSV